MAIFDTRTPINYCGLVNEFFATRATNQNIGVVAYERLKNAFKQFVSEKLQSAMETDMTWHETVFETHNGQLYAVTYAEYLGDSSRYSDRCLFKTNNENSGGSTGNPGTATSSTGSRTANCCCYQNNIPVMYPMDKIEWRNEYYFPDVPCTHKPEGTYQRKFVNGKATNQLRNHTTKFEKKTTTSEVLSYRIHYMVGMSNNAVYPPGFSSANWVGPIATRPTRTNRTVTMYYIVTTDTYLVNGKAICSNQWGQMTSPPNDSGGSYNDGGNGRSEDGNGGFDNDNNGGPA